MSNSEAFFLQKLDQSFGTYDVRHEEMHPELAGPGTHHALTETQYFGFSIPDQNILAFLYLWYHPNLKVVSGGPMIMRGIKPTAPCSEIFDYRAYLPDAMLRGTLTNYRLDNSYAVEMLEPGRKFRVRYDDEPRRNRFDVTFSAVSDPIMWPNGCHYEQVMRVEGELELQGTRYDVRCFNVRDRSWGEARREDSIAGPPISWLTGVIDDGFAFNVTGYDDPDLNPIWKDMFPIEKGSAHKFGWVIVDRKPLGVKSARMLTEYDPDLLLPTSVQVHVTDALDQEHLLQGTIVAGAPFPTWPSVCAPICLARWTYRGRTGWGDVQQLQGTNFLSGRNRSGPQRRSRPAAEPG